MKLKQLLLFVIILLASCFATFSLFSQPPSTNLLVYFPLNGNTTNTGPANVTASAVSTTYTTNNGNLANHAVQFGGNLNSYINFVDNGNLDFSGNNNFTISFSFFFNGAANCGIIDNCLNYGGWGVWFWKQNNVWNIQFNYKNASVGSTAATAFTINQWHHVAAVRNNGTISLYIDGVFRLSTTEGTMVPSYPINMIAGAMAFASYNPPRYNPLDGKLDELRVYNRALSAGEIAILAPYSLPLKLGEFTALKKPTGIQLNWETLNEQNTSHFEIEKSSNSNTWNSIGRVAAAGNSTDKKNYEFTDISLNSGTVFYRLKMVDIDGTFTYSRIVAVKQDINTQAVTIFPNPATDLIQVQIPASSNKQSTIIIADALGRQYRKQSVQIRSGINTISIPIQHLASGNYYLIVEDNNERQTKQFVKK